MKKRIMALILSGCVLMQGSELISWAAETPEYTLTENANGIEMSDIEDIEIMQIENNEAENSGQSVSGDDISDNNQESENEGSETDLVEEQNDVAEQPEEAVGEAAYMELGADEKSIQKVQYAQSSVNGQAVGNGTIKAVKGLYFGYTVEDSANHTGVLSEYLSESGNIVIPHKLGSYYMVGIGNGVFSGMNRTDPSNLSKLPAESSAGKTLLSSGEEKILELVNEARISQGKVPLVMSSTLREAARRKTLDMFNNNYFDHLNPDGTYTYAWLSSCGYPL